MIESDKFCKRKIWSYEIIKILNMIPTTSGYCCNKFIIWWKIAKENGCVFITYFLKIWKNLNHLMENQSIL